MTWYLLAALAILIALAYWNHRRKVRQELSDGLLRSLLYRTRSHPRKFAEVAPVSLKVIERTCRKLVKRGLMGFEDIESSAHHWGAAVQRYYVLTQAGRDRAAQLEEDKWKGKE